MSTVAGYGKAVNYIKLCPRNCRALSCKGTFTLGLLTGSGSSEATLSAASSKTKPLNSSHNKHHGVYSI